eukprot:3370912-Amphidinium_carterae.2
MSLSLANAASAACFKVPPCFATAASTISLSLFITSAAYIKAYRHRFTASSALEGTMGASIS